MTARQAARARAEGAGARVPAPPAASRAAAQAGRALSRRCASCSPTCASTRRPGAAPRLASAGAAAMVVGRRRRRAGAGDARTAPVSASGDQDGGQRGRSAARRARDTRGHPAAFVATGAGLRRRSTWQRASGLLDDYARRLVAEVQARLRGDARARASSRPTCWTLRLACLDERRDALRALTDVFAHADTSVVVQAVNAVRELPSVDRCDVLRSIRARRPPRRAGAARPCRVTARALAEVKALSDTGQWHRPGPTGAPRRRRGAASATAPCSPRCWDAERFLEGNLGAEMAAEASTGASAVGGGRRAPRRRRARERAAARRRLSATTSIDGTARRTMGPSRPGAAHTHSAPVTSVPPPGCVNNRASDPAAATGIFRGAGRIARAALALKQQVLPPSIRTSAGRGRSIGRAYSARWATTRARWRRWTRPRHLPAGVRRRQSAARTSLANRGEELRFWAATARPSPSLRLAIERWTTLVGEQHHWLAYPLTALGKTWSRTADPRRRLTCWSAPFAFASTAKRIAACWQRVNLRSRARAGTSAAIARRRGR